MRRSSKYLYILLLCTSVTFVSFAQSRTNLEKERDRLVEQIEIANQQLKEAESTTKSSITELEALSAKIRSREKLIANLQKQLSIGVEGIETNTDSIVSMDLHLEKVNKNFTSILRLANQKRRSHNPWISLFSANSINEAILIFRYANQFHNFLDRKKEQIKSLQHALENKTQTIVEEQAYIETLLSEEKSNYEKLETARSQKNELVHRLKKDESSIRANLDQKKGEREKLNTRIEKIIIAELQKKNKVTSTANTVAVKKKSLSWPVQNGYISGKFGQQAHPTISNLKVNNNGIDISTKANSQVYTVLAGTVVGVTAIPGFDTMIIIEHGDLYTVYSKLERATVSKGDKVALGQKVGVLGKIGNLHFEIWKGKQKLNPQIWLKKQ